MLSSQSKFCQVTMNSNEANQMRKMNSKIHENHVKPNETHKKPTKTK